MVEFSEMPCNVLTPSALAKPAPLSAVPPPRVMLPPLLVIPEPVLKTMPPPLVASESLLKTTLSFPIVDVMVLLAATLMLACACSVKVASPPTVLLMLSLMAMLPVLLPAALVARVTDVPLFRLALMSEARITESAAAV